MAIYHKDLEYHEDKIVKHDITKEEIEFLQGLQKEMNTQDHVDEADPRYWVIKGTKKKYEVEDGDEELIDEDGNIIADTMEELMKYIQDNLLGDINKRTRKDYKLELNSNDDIIISWDVDGEKDTDTLFDMDDVIDWLNSFWYDKYQCVTYKMVDKIYPDTMFLTQKAAEDHLRRNYYHYSDDAHTYAMTAWRDPEVEKLWKILQEVDWDKINLKEE